jgi:hypothetical protein
MFHVGSLVGVQASLPAKNGVLDLRLAGGVQISYYEKMRLPVDLNER